MRIRLVFAVLALLSSSFLASPVAASGVVLGNSCPDLGATAMADTHTAILLCAFPTENTATNCGNPSACKWKPMSESGTDMQCSGIPLPDNTARYFCVNDKTGAIYKQDSANPGAGWVKFSPPAGYPVGGGNMQCQAKRYSGDPWNRDWVECIDVNSGTVCYTAFGLYNWTCATLANFGG